MSDRDLIENIAVALAAHNEEAHCWRGYVDAATAIMPLVERRIADERRKVIAELEEGLAELELHDDLPDSHDLGYMACWRDVRDLAASLLTPVGGTLMPNMRTEGSGPQTGHIEGRNDKVLSEESGGEKVAHNEEASA